MARIKMNPEEIHSKHTNRDDLDAVFKVHKAAFGSCEEAKLSLELLKDPTSEPLVSILAYHQNRVVGHVLFTRVFINGNPEPLAHLLAPMAVIPDFQRKGIGGMLIKQGLKALEKIDAELCFVLGHIEYYPKFGFINNAALLGFEAPYPIPEKVADAWMVQEIKKGAVNHYHGKIRCAKTLMKPEYWRE